VPGDERLWVAGGYSGHGNVLGFLCGELVAAAILGEPDPLLGHFDPARLVS
jgi:glycine/D-amino acid oxidase-like deaminating enzyme